MQHSHHDKDRSFSRPLARQPDTNDDGDGDVDVVGDSDEGAHDTNSRWWAADEYLLCGSPMVSSPRLIGGGVVGGHPSLDRREKLHHQQNRQQHRSITSAPPYRGLCRDEVVIKYGNETKNGGDDGDDVIISNTFSTAISPLLGRESTATASKNNTRYLRGMTTSGLSLMDFDNDNNTATTAIKDGNGLVKDVELMHDEINADKVGGCYKYGAIPNFHDYRLQSKDDGTASSGFVNTTSSSTIPQCYQPAPMSAIQCPQNEVDGVENCRESRKQFKRQDDPTAVELPYHRKHSQPQQARNPPCVSILFGLVNTSIVLPIIMSFGSIIYQHEFFRPYLSILMKLTVISGAVHQLVFSTISSLPFAVGQVQDAGELFHCLYVSSHCCFLTSKSTSISFYAQD